MMTVRKGRGGAGASAVEARGRRRSVRRGMGGCSVVRTRGSIEVTPSRSGRSDATGVASDEGVVGPLTHVVSSGPLVPALEVVKVDGVLGYSDVFLDDRIETSLEVHHIDGHIGCSGEVDQLLEVVDVLVDGLPALVVASRYERCECDSSFVLWAELLFEVLEDGPQSGEREGAKLRFGAEEALSEDGSASRLHVQQDPPFFFSSSWNSDFRRVKYSWHEVRKARPFDRSPSKVSGVATFGRERCGTGGGGGGYEYMGVATAFAFCCTMTDILAVSSVIAVRIEVCCCWYVSICLRCASSWRSNFNIRKPESEEASLSSEGAG